MSHVQSVNCTWGQFTHKKKVAAKGYDKLFVLPEGRFLGKSQQIFPPGPDGSNHDTSVHGLAYCTVKVMNDQKSKKMVLFKEIQPYIK